MVKIRLTKLGRHKLPIYRIIAIDQRKKRDSDNLALLGTYEPLKGKFNINEELMLKFLSQGAQPTETILSLLKKQKIWTKFLASKKIKKNKKRKISKKIKAKKIAKKNMPKKAKVVVQKKNENNKQLDVKQVASKENK